MQQKAVSLYMRFFSKFTYRDKMHTPPSKQWRSQLSIECTITANLRNITAKEINYRGTRAAHNIHDTKENGADEKTRCRYIKFIILACDVSMGEECWIQDIFIFLACGDIEIICELLGRKINDHVLKNFINTFYLCPERPITTLGRFLNTVDLVRYLFFFIIQQKFNVYGLSFDVYGAFEWGDVRNSI